MASIIAPGFYQSKTSLNSDKPEIIRIIGIDPNNSGYWLTQFNEKIPEYALIENYEKCDFYLTPEAANIKKSRDKKLFGDFEPVKLDENQPKKDPEFVPLQKTIQQPEVREQRSVISHVVENVPKISEYDLILKKCKCSPKVINLPIKFTFNYDLEKLNKTLELLDIDVNSCINDLLESLDKNEIIDIFKSALKEKIQNIQKVQQVVEQKSEEDKPRMGLVDSNSEEMTEKMAIIDKFLYSK